MMSGRGKKRQSDGKDPEDGARAAGGGKAGGGKAGGGGEKQGKKSKKAASKKSTQLTVFGAGVMKKAPKPLLVNENVLFTAEQLYKGKPPCQLQGLPI